MDTVITVFGSAQPSPGDDAYAEAEHLGFLLAQAGFSFCNGGYGGTMEASAKGANAAGGTAIGVTISALYLTPNRWLTTVIPMATLVERLQKLLELGDGFVVLRGGTYELIGIFQLRSNQPKLAIDSFNRALAINPASVNAHYNIAFAYFDLKDYVISNEHAQRAYALGAPLPGLREKLRKAGKWNPSAAPAAQAPPLSSAEPNNPASEK